jgi:hypothetical protein
MNHQRLNVYILATLFLVGGFSGSLAQDIELTPVKLTYVNTTDKPVHIVFIKEDGGKKSEITYADALPSKYEYEQVSYAGQVWHIKQDGKVVAKYEVDAAPVQTIDIQTLAVWQTPVQLVFQNTSTASLDIFWVDPYGEETVYAPELPPDREYAQEALPGQHWRIRNGDEIVAEYVPDTQRVQVLELQRLIETYIRPVELTFVNSTGLDVDVMWVTLNNEEIIYRQGLPAGGKHVQAAYPLQLWRIQQGEKIIAEYIPLEEPAQTVDIGYLVETQARPNAVAGANGTSNSTASETANHGAKPTRKPPRRKPPRRKPPKP